jgi:hypothetical protein
VRITRPAVLQRAAGIAEEQVISVHREVGGLVLRVREARHDDRDERRAVELEATPDAVDAIHPVEVRGAVEVVVDELVSAPGRQRVRRGRPVDNGSAGRGGDRLVVLEDAADAAEHEIACGIAAAPSAAAQHQPADGARSGAGATRDDKALDERYRPAVVWQRRPEVDSGPTGRARHVEHPRRRAIIIADGIHVLVVDPDAAHIA